MSTVIDLGKLRFHYRGSYNSANQYEFNDVVVFGGNAYCYISSTATIGQSPSNTTYWAQMVSGLSARGTYNGATAYQVNDLVVSGANTYRCIAASTGNQPPNATYWEVFVQGLASQGAYNAATAYGVNDVVVHGGSVYRCIANSTGNEPPNATYWEQLVGGYKHRGTWATATDYKVNDAVIHLGQSYRALANHTSGTFYTDFTSSSRWQRFASGQQSRGVYTNGTAYFQGDLVSVGTAPNLDYYLCLTDHIANGVNITDGTEIANWQLLISGTYTATASFLQYAYFVAASA
jgi:hypothetical protein